MNRISLELLPTKEGVGALKNKKVIDWVNSENIVLDFEYNGVVGNLTILKYYKNRRLDILYNGEVFNKTLDTISMCKLGGIVGTKTNKFKINIGQTFNINGNSIEILDRKKEGRFKYYRVKCNNCNYIGWKDEGNILGSKKRKPKGCPCCCNPPQVVVPEINSIYAKAPWMIDLGVSEEDAVKHTPQSNKKIEVTCPDCGKRKHHKGFTFRYNIE